MKLWDIVDIVRCFSRPLKWYAVTPPLWQFSRQMATSLAPGHAWQHRPAEGGNVRWVAAGPLRCIVGRVVATSCRSCMGHGDIYGTLDERRGIHENTWRFFYRVMQLVHVEVAEDPLRKLVSWSCWLMFKIVLIVGQKTSSDERLSVLGWGGNIPFAFYPSSLSAGFIASWSVDMCKEVFSAYPSA